MHQYLPRHWKIIPTVLGTQFQLQVLFGTWSFSYLLTDWLTDWLLCCDVRPTPRLIDYSINKLHSTPTPSRVREIQSFKIFWNSFRKKIEILFFIWLAWEWQVTRQYNVPLTERLSISTLYLNHNFNIFPTTQIPVNSQQFVSFNWVWNVGREKKNSDF